MNRIGCVWRDIASCLTVRMPLGLAWSRILNVSIQTPQAPEYEDHGRHFQADACQPVRRAAEAGAIGYAALVRGQYHGVPIPEDRLLGIRAIGNWDIDSLQDWFLPWHRNEGIELTYLESGSLSFNVEGGAYQLHDGDLTFTRPWQLHRLGAPRVSPSRLHWLILDVDVRQPHQDWRWPNWLVLTPDDMAELSRTLRHSSHAVWHTDNEMRQCFERIGAAVGSDQRGSNASRLTAYLNELFVLLLDTLRRGDVTLDAYLASARHTVQLFWEDLNRSPQMLARPWSVQEMAHQCGMGVTQFTDHCKKLQNMTPVDVLNRIRIDWACRVLREEPHKKITEVALECGFSTSQYFSKVFRQYKGRTPSAYRQNM
jgi:AraC family L-rhamnose operon regulatory protein RhaS